MEPSAAPNLLVVPSPPRTPSPTARQLVFRLQGAQVALVLVGGIFFLVGSVLTLAFDWRLPAELAISLGGHAATGHVTATEVERNVRINGRHPTLISFTYDEGGVPRRAQSRTLDDAILAAVRPGGDVPIEVAGANAGWARVRGTTVSLLGPWGLFTLVFPSLGAILLLVGLRGRRRAIRAFIHGQPIAARVTFAGPDRTIRINGRNPLMVRWEFTLEGRVFEGKVSSLHPTLLEPLMQKKELVVLYDPDNPRINTCYVE